MHFIVLAVMSLIVGTPPIADRWMIGLCALVFFLVFIVLGLEGTGLDNEKSKEPVQPPHKPRGLQIMEADDGSTAECEVYVTDRRTAEYEVYVD